MSRYIDADMLMEYCRNHKDKKIDCNDIARFPTAYDVSKVVEELEKEKNIHTEHFNISIYKDMPEIKQRYKQAIAIIDNAIEIVKAGGVNDIGTDNN